MRPNVHLLLWALIASAILYPRAAEAQNPKPGSARALFSRLLATTSQNDPALQRAVIDEFSKSIAIGIATTPIGASSAGFSYEFDTQTGDRTLKSQSFGPLFVERPLTNGRGVFNAGVSFSRASYSEFLGIDLGDGIRLFNNRVRFLDTNFEQYIEEYLAATPRVTTFNTIASFGITKSLDIGVLVPISSVKVDSRVYLNYDISRSYPLVPSDRAFFTQGPRGTNFQPRSDSSGSVSATGIGDVSVRAKYAFGPQGRQLGAAVVDVRLPTGEEDDFLGAGKTSTRVAMLGTAPLGNAVALHFNGGYRFGGLTDEADYAAALDVALLPTKKLTLSAELLGQYLKEGATEIREAPLGGGPTTIPSSLGGVPVTVVLDNRAPVFELGGVNNLRAAIGVKYNIASAALITAGMLVPMTDKGLTSDFTAFVGLDFSLSRR